MRHALSGLCCALGLVAPLAGQTVIDFQSLESPTQTNVGTSYAEDGFTISGTQLASIGTGADEYAGSTGLLENALSGTITLTSDGGAAFDMTSIDLSWATEAFLGAVTVAFTGQRADGSTVTDFATYSTFGFQSFPLTQLTNVVSVSWNQGSLFLPSGFHQFDDIVLTLLAADPVALCQDVQATADPLTGTADVLASEVDAGSFDPDGGAVFLDLSPAGPYPVGDTAVTLTVTDDEGVTATCAATISVAPPPVLFIRGDANSDGSVKTNDARYILRFLRKGDPLPCEDAADVDDDGDVDDVDAVLLLEGLIDPGPPFPGCGVDPTADAIGCTSYDAC